MSVCQCMHQHRTQWMTDLGCKRRRLFRCTEKLGCSCPLNILHFLVVEEADGGAAPYYPRAVVLYPPPDQFRIRFYRAHYRTSFLVTGLSSSVRCVSFVKCLSVSKSANSAKLFCVRIRHVRFGIEFASVGCMLVIRLRASRRVRSRGERGKLERVEISLSVKSIASWSCKCSSAP